MSDQFLTNIGLAYLGEQFVINKIGGNVLASLTEVCLFVYLCLLSVCLSVYLSVWLVGMSTCLLVFCLFVWK